MSKQAPERINVRGLKQRLARSSEHGYSARHCRASSGGKEPGFGKDEARTGLTFQYSMDLLHLHIPRVMVGTWSVKNENS